MADIEKLKKANSDRWQKAKPTRSFAPVAARLFSAKERYQAVSRMTGVPWWFVAVVHQRESSQSWAKSLAQGDPWDQVSVHIPRGRGPFQSWEAAAVDALVNCPPYAAKWKDWSTGGTLTLLETYNGLGYANRGIPSPYVWSGTDQYKSGKYVADGKFDPSVIDAQLGCAGLLIAMRKLDPTIRFTDEAMPPPDVEPAPKPQGPPAGKKAAGAVVSGTGAATAAHQAGFEPWMVVAIALAAAVVGALIVHFLSNRKS